MDRTRLINLIKLLVFLAVVGIFVLALLSPDLLFLLINVIPLPFWFLMIFLPRRPITRQVTSNYLVFLVLGAFYILIHPGLRVCPSEKTVVMQRNTFP